MKLTPLPSVVGCTSDAKAIVAILTRISEQLTNLEEALDRMNMETRAHRLEQKLKERCKQ